MSIKRSKNTARKVSSAKAQFDEEKDIDYEAVFLSVLNSLEEEVSTADELTLLLQHGGCNPSRRTMAKYWDDKTESYTFHQFCSILKQVGRSSREDLLKAFLKIDHNGDGFITHEELFQLLTKRGERMTRAEVKVMIEDADFNGDGKLDYAEFCSLMDSTTKQCEQLYSINRIKNMKLKDHNTRPTSASSNYSSLVGNKRNSLKGSESKTLLESSGGGRKMLKQEPAGTRAKQMKEEPKDLNKWHFISSKGCFYKEDEGSVVSHQFIMEVTQPTTVWIAIKPTIPKYGKAREDILDSDMSVFLVEDTTGKLIAFSDISVGEKMCLLADVDIGAYNVLCFSSGTKLYGEQSESGKVSLAKGTGDDCKLTKACKDSLMEIFYRSDLDGNGFLSRNEFNEFQMRSSGEECDDEAWEVLKGTVEQTPQSEITLKGFLDLNLLEVRDPDGGQDELWITLESLGYSNKLLLTKACPFLLEVFMRKGSNKLTLIGVGDGGVPLQDAMIESIKITSEVKPIKNKRDLHLHIAQCGKRTTIAVNNQSHSDMRIQVDCSASENLISDKRSLNVAQEVDSRMIRVVHHLTPDNKDIPSKLKYQESILQP